MPSSTLASVICAAICGVTALVVWNDAAGTLAATLVGAALGGIWSSRGDRHQAQQTRGPENALPATDTGRSALLSALPVGAMVIGADRVITDANARIEALFGQTGIIGQPVAVLRSRRLLDGIEEVFRDQQHQSFEVTLSRAEDLYLRAEIVPIPGESDQGLLVTIRDETAAQKAIEVHRDFVANASHELKTPLAASSGIIETLIGPARDDRPATERFLGMLAQQNTRMHRVVEDLLSLNRIELNARVAPDTEVSLVPILSEVLDTLTPIAEANGVDLNFEPPQASPVIVADRDEIAQLLRNLVDNAIKYGGEGKPVTVQVTTDPVGEQVCVSVQDLGPGIAREHLPRLTERFYRVNARHSREIGGTGLGLAICKHILARHRGRLEIESEIGEGSVFKVWLPVSG